MSDLPGILAHCRYLLHTSLLERINVEITFIKRIADGYCDNTYLVYHLPAVGYIRCVRSAILDKSALESSRSSA